MLDRRADLHRAGLAAQVGPLDPNASDALASISQGLMIARHAPGKYARIE